MQLPPGSAGRQLPSVTNAGSTDHDAAGGRTGHDTRGSRYHSLLDADAVRRALAADQPRLVFQPIVDLRDRRLIGMEALARFDLTPDAPPDVWFESAHRVGLGIELEGVVVRKAARAVTTLPPDLYMAVNLSPATILAFDVAQYFDAGTRMQVVIEITEHAPVDDYGALRQALRRLRQRGLRIAIDDVGAGFSSLRHVLRLDPEIIKLDQEVTLGVDQDVGRAKLVGGLIAGASAVSALVVAEGIETEAQLVRLLELGVRGGQGFFIGRPTELQQAITAANNAVTALHRPVTRAPSLPQRSRPALREARILVVDDSVAHRALIRTTFELEGATVHEAATATAALRAVEAVRPDVVLLDIRLHDSNGFEVLAQIRHIADVPVMIVTAATAVSDRVAGMDEGADDYLLKPFSPDELIARVDAILRRRRT